MSTSLVIGLTLNYRDAGRTVRCIRSLLDDGAAHVLVLDNSEDNGASAHDIRGVLGRDPRVNLQISPHNLGFAAGVNRGLDWIRVHFPGTWTLLINNDAVVLPGATDALLARLAEHTEAVVAYPTIDHDGHKIGTAFYQRHFGLYTTKRLPGSIPYASGCCQLIAPERMDGPWFDEDFFMYGEDVELGYRLGNQRMAHVPEACVLHEVSASSGRGSPFYETHIVAAHWLLMHKLAKNPIDIGLFCLGRMLALTSRAMVRTFRYRSLVPIKALWAGLRLANGC